MDTSTNETAVVKHQVKFTFTGLLATVNVTGTNGDDYKEVFDITPLSDEIKLELIQYGFKQKLSDFRAGDKLKGPEKMIAMAECYEMLEAGNFRQKREPSGMPFEEQLKVFAEMSVEEQEGINLINPKLYQKFKINLELQEDAKTSS